MKIQNVDQIRRAIRAPAIAQNGWSTVGNIGFAVTLANELSAKKGQTVVQSFVVQKDYKLKGTLHLPFPSHLSTLLQRLEDIGRYSGVH